MDKGLLYGVGIHNSCIFFAYVFVFHLGCATMQLFVTGMFQRFAFLLHIPFSVPFYFHALL